MPTMARKGLRTDELIDLLKDENVATAIWDGLLTKITPLIDTIVAKITSNLNANVEEIIKRVTDETKKKTEQKLRDQEERISSLERDNTDLQSKIDNVENNSRQMNLVIHGLQESPPLPMSSSQHQPKPAGPHQQRGPQHHEFLDVCNKFLELSVSAEDISFAFRIPARGKATSRPLIVGFTSKKLRDEILATKKP